MRLFIALPVPAEVRGQLRRLQVEWRGRLTGEAIRWTRPEQIHLTLKFLGNLPADRLEELVRATRGACAGHEPFQLHAERIGFFPHVRSPRVVWAWAHDDRGRLLELQRAVASATAGFANDEKAESFTGHLTIGRVRHLQPTQARVLAELARAAEGRVFGDWTADTVELMRSELSGAGSRHTVLAAIPLTRRGRP